MNPLRNAVKHRRRHGPRVRRSLPLVSLLAFSLLLAGVTAASAATSSTTTPASLSGHLSLNLQRSARFSVNAVEGPTLTMAHSLSVEADAAGELTASVGTVEGQLSTALGEMGNVSGSAALDPNYAAALTAVEQAYATLSGQNPITGSAIDLGGLKAQLEESAETLGGLSGTATTLSTRVERLSTALRRARRAARRLARQSSQG